MAKQIMSYETVMIFNTQLGEEGVTALANKFKTLIAENGTIDKVEEWGKRRMAYPIQDELDGFYLLVEFTSNPAFPAELDRVYKITDGVLRTLIVCKEEDNAKTRAWKAKNAAKVNAAAAAAEAAAKAAAEAAAKAAAEAAAKAAAEAAEAAAQPKADAVTEENA